MHLVAVRPAIAHTRISSIVIALCSPTAREPSQRSFHSSTLSSFRYSAVRQAAWNSPAKMAARSFKITDWVDPKDKSGEFKRQTSSFRDWIGRPSEEGGAVQFPVEKDRYHLYVSTACPWATRTLIARKLKGLEDIVSVTVVHWKLAEGGWRFATAEDQDAPGEHVEPDPVPGHEDFTHLRQVYIESAEDYTGRVTVPVLYDKKQKRVVNNESSEILRIFNSAFNDLLEPKYRNIDLYPEALHSEIEAANAWQYDNINNGVYKSGFATTQAAYERNVVLVFDALDRAEKHLAGNTANGPYWFGKTMTEVDIRLFATIVRFDPVYVQHFKCNLADIRSGYPHLHKWMRNLYWNVSAFKDSTDFLHIKSHYTKSHTQINPFSITPLGPKPDIFPLDEEVPAVKASGKL
ncbi:cell wall biogenesis protein glutathione transferase [Grosmannia clavigera kw1407]|uniref:Cell wall biogenesis protein glutathione transferase n=1 Tax=Grosmannia clavigera (strain kw1407 / UAMH 11150) TaxID=655863 RepID=F0XFE1_GROCL|nr:cell wall biogenesis protein glutathione transferase [Grosmannia clavigera kw1407]EFX03788.1 cell wall biogenesis protein glutathione transferase [Grosmannia clavigera kw1407]